MARAWFKNVPIFTVSALCHSMIADVIDEIHELIMFVYHKLSEYKDMERVVCEWVLDARIYELNILHSLTWNVTIRLL